MLDTGAEANILPFALYKQVCSLLLRPTSIVLCGFGNAVIKPLGSMDVAVCDREGREFLLLFYVTDIINLPILGEHAVTSLGSLPRERVRLISNYWTCNRQKRQFSMFYADSSDD